MAVQRLEQTELFAALHISKGNTKVLQTLIWNLPAKATCPGATYQCITHCYAMKAQRMYTATKETRLRNMQASLHPQFVETVIMKIQDIRKRTKKTFEYFRIHESGDFYSQRYLDNWARIARAFPDMKFLAYTKSHHLDFSKCPENMVIRYSVWEDSEVVRTDMPLAIMDGLESHTKQVIDCKPGQKCGPCRACWNSKADVKFHLH